MPRAPRRTSIKRVKTSRRRRRPSKKRFTRTLRRAPTSTIHVGRSLLPKTKLATMRYANTFNLSHGGGGVVGKYVFRANSLYDPDFTGVGTQPLLRDQWANIYQNYIVVGSKIVATFATQSTSVTTQNSFVGLRLQDSDTLTDTDPADLTMQSNQVWGFVGSADGGRPMKTLTKGFSHKKFFNYTDLRDNVDTYKHPFATASVEPTGSDSRAPFFVIWTAPMQAGETPTGINCFVQMEFSVLLMNPITDQTQS